MRSLPIEILGINLESPLPRPQTRREAALDAFAGWLCDTENGLALRADQVRLKQWDELFGYELTAQFFGDNGTVVRLADRVRLSVRNIRTAGDWELVRRLVVRFYQQLDLPATPVTTFGAHLHSRLESQEEIDDYFRPFPQNERVARPTCFGYVKIIDWEAPIRVLIEQSNAFPHALFLAWETQFPNKQDWESFIGTLPTVLDNSTHVFDLSLASLK